MIRVLILLLGLFAYDQVVADPVMFIKKMDEKVRSVKGSTRSLESVVDAHLAKDKIAEFVLGKYSRDISEQQKQEFITVYGDHLVRDYAKKIAIYYGAIKVISYSAMSKNRYIVNTTVMMENTSPTKVNISYILVKNNEDYLVLDVISEGIRLSFTERAQVHSVVERHGINGLMSYLRNS